MEPRAPQLRAGTGRRDRDCQPLRQRRDHRQGRLPPPAYQRQSARLLCAYLYADAGHGESTTDMTFAGHNLIAENGTLLAETAPLKAAPL